MPTELTLQILQDLMRMGRLVEGKMDNLLDELELSSTRMLALRRLIAAEEPISLSQLASCMSFVKSNATQLIDHLEASGLVRRIPSPSDRRCTLLEITEIGKTRYWEGLTVSSSLVDRIDQVYSPAEREQLAALLSKLNSEMG